MISKEKPKESEQSYFKKITKIKDQNLTSSKNLNKNIYKDQNLKKPVKRYQEKKQNTTKNIKDEPRNLEARRNGKLSRNSTVKFPSIKTTFLGGLNEIGKNITLFECENDMFIIDCGMAFPSEEMPGVDIVIPDFSYVLKNKDKIRGIILTHGHEDHIGSIQYLLRDLNVPIFGTLLTIGLVGGKLKEHNLFNSAKLHVVRAKQKVKLGCISFEFIHVNHSIPDSVAVAMYTPAGTIVHTGDFKIDCTPARGKMIDLSKFSELGEKGVLALFSDSTNAERSGYTMTEKKVSASFEILFKEAENKRIVIASFASNISRIQQIVDCASKHGRKIAFSGRSMLNYVAIAKDLGYLKMPDEILIDIQLLNKYPKEKTVLITTGSQGEPMSALSRMANSEHKKVEVGPEDVIIISANPIPGNEKMVNSVINELMKLGCKVVYESMYDVHVSGHACQEELKIMQGIVKPKYFIPIHGEQKHLREHGKLAKEMGISDSNIFIGDVGDVLELNKNYMKKIGSVPAGYLLVDGLGVGDVGSVVLRDRKHLAQDGLIVVVATLDSSNGYIVSGPDIVSRGFVYVRESEPLIDEARKKTLKILEGCIDNKVYEWGLIKSKIKDDLSKLFYDKTKRDPMILPVLMEV